LNSALSVVKGSSCTVTVAFWGPVWLELGTRVTAPELVNDPPLEAAMVYGPSTTDQMGLDEKPEMLHGQD
jgi:hypothetical protein